VAGYYYHTTTTTTAATMSPKVPTCDNYIGGMFVAPVKGQYMDVHNPVDGSVIAKVAVSTVDDVTFAVERAKAVSSDDHDDDEDDDDNGDGVEEEVF